MQCFKGNFQNIALGLSTLTKSYQSTKLLASLQCLVGMSIMLACSEKKCLSQCLFTHWSLRPTSNQHVKALVWKLWQNLFFFLVLLRLINGNLHYTVCIIFPCIILLQKRVIPSSPLLPHTLNLIVLMDNHLHILNPSLTPHGLTGYSSGFASPWHSFPTDVRSAFVSAVVDMDAFDFHFLNHSSYVLLRFQQMELSK